MKYCNINSKIWASALCIVLGTACFSSCDEYERTPVTNEIYVNKSSVSLFVGAEEKLTVSPEGNKAQWTSDDETVAVVDASGTVRGVAPGSTTVRATIGSISSSVNVTVRERISLRDIELSETVLDIDPMSTTSLSVTLVPADANDVAIDDCEWWSDDESLVRVTLAGTVSSLDKQGSTYIHYRRGSIVKDLLVYVSYTHPFQGPHILSKEESLVLPFIDFDLGGKNRAWFDTTGGNSGGGSYRSGKGDNNSADVDIVNRKYIGYTASGEWLVYTLDVEDAGTYNVDFSVGTKGGGLFHLEIDDVDVTGQIELATSGSLTKFAYTTSTAISLPKGRSKLKFFMDKASYNLLEMKFTYSQP
ncbi:MAG: Ig-like domain-containing protein [Muribaculaceae bacterium]